MLAMKEDDVTKMLAAGVHLGDSNVNFQMQQYVYKVRNNGTAIINLRKTWEKLLLAARVIAAIENPSDICILSNRLFGQRAILKFAKYTGAQPVAGRFTPGTFTNQIQKAFREPRLLVVSDPVEDRQPITEASYVNIPVIAFCNTNSHLRYIDIAIPCNTAGKHSLGLMWWLLSREVMRLKGSISREIPWDVMPDLFFYREPEEVEKDEQMAKIEQEEIVETQGDWAEPTTAAAGATADEKWRDTTAGSDWTTEGTATSQTIAAAAGGGGAAAPGPIVHTGEQDWNIGPTTTTKDWADDAGEWAASEPQATTGNW